MKKILMVCMGNICRSPMAQAVLQKAIVDAKQTAHLSVDSAGTAAQHHGEKADPRALAALKARGYPPLRHRSRRVVPKDYESFDLILAMDRHNMAELQKNCPAEHVKKLRLFLEITSPASDQQAAMELPDPYYGNRLGFEKVLDTIEKNIREIMNKNSMDLL